MELINTKFHNATYGVDLHVNLSAIYMINNYNWWKFQRQYKPPRIFDFKNTDNYLFVDEFVETILLVICVLY